jgi:heme exporter protein D
MQQFAKELPEPLRQPLTYQAIRSSVFGMFRTIPFTAMNKLVSFVWIAAVCQIISGVTLWITKILTRSPRRRAAQISFAT